MTAAEPVGLSAGEARARRQQVGPNEPAPPARSSVALQFLLLFANPLAVVLLLAAGASAAVGEATSAGDLHVQQAALTGEPLPVEKDVTPTGAGPTRPGDPGAVFLGTSVVSGTAVAEVTATGRATAFGDIAARLRDRPPENEFERGT